MPKIWSIQVAQSAVEEINNYNAKWMLNKTLDWDKLKKQDSTLKSKICNKKNETRWRRLLWLQNSGGKEVLALIHHYKIPLSIQFRTYRFTKWLILPIMVVLFGNCRSNECLLWHLLWSMVARPKGGQCPSCCRVAPVPFSKFIAEENLHMKTLPS